MFDIEDLNPLFELEPLELYVSVAQFSCYAYTGDLIKPGEPKRYPRAALILSHSTIVPKCILEIFRRV